mmetsp:Transcript_77897/g.215285  ORF Transcript_77897/g.215285 Transcript_77897/m.215285 type:complete len:129 (-) Transcript_77897:297-683(-)
MAFQHLTSGFSTAEHPCRAEMVELAEALADERKLPQGTGERLKSAIVALRKVGGEHLLMDAAAVASFFSTMTIVVDSTGHQSATSDFSSKAVEVIMGVKRKTKRLLPVVASVVALAVAGYIAKRRRLV